MAYEATSPLTAGIGSEQARKRDSRYRRNRKLGIRSRMVPVTDGELDQLVAKGYLTARGDPKAEAEAIAAALADFLGT